MIFNNNNKGSSNALGMREAKLFYGDSDYLEDVEGDYVRCAVTNKMIMLDELKYWSVDRQEAYCDAASAVKAMAY